MKSRIMNALELLSGEPLRALKGLSESELYGIDEIRLRTNRPVSISKQGRDILLDASATAEDIEHTFKTAFSYSVHSYSKELASGYITTSGGNRVGICGTAVTSAEQGDVSTLKYISSVNIRISREITGCADGIFEKCFSEGLCGAIIIGPPSSGKTTVLRDLTRRLGNVWKISLIDELNEISATHKNAAQNDIGCLTDVFVGYPKHRGIETAVRVMSPRAVVVDEIGSEKDGEALDFSLHSGVRLITAAHAFDLEDAMKKPVIKKLMDHGAFDWAAELKPDRSVRVRKID